MYPPRNILSTWRKFDHFPMETLTKAWFYNQNTKKKQRDVSLMKEHRDQYGISGNCFDLAIWLLDEFQNDRITSYPIGHHLGTSHAHVAIIALDDQGNRFLCDLGDQWLNPILIENQHSEFSEKKLSGFFPAADVQVKMREGEVEILYHRPNGRVSKQVYETTPIERVEFLQVAEFSQNILKPRPLLECRLPYKSEIAHWEFYNWESFLSTTEGLFPDRKLDRIEDWANLIHGKTGYDLQFLKEALEIYINEAIWNT